MEPLVSAVVITHNRKNFLEQALQSVLRQTWPRMEVIVVDDGSTDGTREWMNHFASEYGIDYVYCTDGLGGNHARNIGIRRASGDFIALLDDDDAWLPEKTEKQVCLLLSRPEAGTAACGRIAVDDAGNTEEEPPDLLPEGDLREKIFTDLHFTSSRLMIRASLLKETGLFDESLRAWQDYELMIRLTQYAHVAVVRENLMRYHVASADPAKLTNQIESWAEAVDIIHRKHATLLSALPPETLLAHQLMVCRDGAARADRAGRPDLMRKYLWQAFRLRPTAENFKKALLNRRILEKPPLISRVYARIKRR